MDERMSWMDNDEMDKDESRSYTWQWRLKTTRRMSLNTLVRKKEKGSCRSTVKQLGVYLNRKYKKGRVTNS